MKTNIFEKKTSTRIMCPQSFCWGNSMVCVKGRTHLSRRFESRSQIPVSTKTWSLDDIKVEQREHRKKLLSGHRCSGHCLRHIVHTFIIHSDHVPSTDNKGGCSTKKSKESSFFTSTKYEHNFGFNQEILCWR